MILDLNTQEKKELVNVLKNYIDYQETGGFQVNKLLYKIVSKIERSEKKIKPRSAKNKGLDWQKEICALVSRITGIEYDQSKDDCEIHSRESGLNGTDVILRGEAKKKFPYCIECKSCNKLNLPEWIRQAESNADNGDNWLLFVKSPAISCKKIVTMSLSKFEEMFIK